MSVICVTLCSFFSFFWSSLSRAVIGHGSGAALVPPKMIRRLPRGQKKNVAFWFLLFPYDDIHQVWNTERTRNDRLPFSMKATMPDRIWRIFFRFVEPFFYQNWNCLQVKFTDIYRVLVADFWGFPFFLNLVGWKRTFTRKRTEHEKKKKAQQFRWDFYFCSILSRFSLFTIFTVFRRFVLSRREKAERLAQSFHSIELYRFALILYFGYRVFFWIDFCSAALQLFVVSFFLKISFQNEGLIRFSWSNRIVNS